MSDLSTETLNNEDNLFSDVYQPTKELLVEGTESVYRTPIENVYFMAGKIYEDDRGSFSAWGRKSEIEKGIGRPFKPAQENLSKSRPGVIRGIHAEYEDKLVTVAAGTVMAAIVDCRYHSPTSKQVVKVLLGDGVDYGLGFQAQGSLFIEGRGIGNSFIAIEGAERPDGQNLVSYNYVVSREYGELTAAEQQPLYIFDSTVGINWPTNLSVEEMLQMGFISKRDLLVRDGGSALEWDEFIERRRF